MGKQHRVNGINVEDYKGTLQNRKKVNTKKIQKEIDKILYQLKNKITLLGMLDFEKKQAEEEERAKQVALEWLKKSSL
jgi:glycine betaine/choline ABC-type transport system substrate-binding protein